MTNTIKLEVASGIFSLAKRNKGKELPKSSQKQRENLR